MLEMRIFEKGNNVEELSYNESVPIYASIS